MRLRDRVAIVTGAARGIGKAYAVALSREGARIVAADVLSCSDTAAAVGQAGGEIVEVTVDVADSQSTQGMAAEALRQFGRIDILVNNAAVFDGLTSTPFDQISEAEWDRVMAVNVKGMWLCSKAVIPTMKKQGKGKIINISSDTIWFGRPFLLHYVTSKGAALVFTRALSRELSGTGINVNAITPGYTITEATKDRTDSETLTRRASAVDRQIIKRNETPEDLIGTVVFLASDDSDFITGQTINVNGGATHH